MPYGKLRALRLITSAVLHPKNACSLSPSRQPSNFCYRCKSNPSWRVYHRWRRERITAQQGTPTDRIMDRNNNPNQLVSVSSGQYMGVRDSLSNSVPYATRDTGRMILHDGNQAVVSVT